MTNLYKKLLSALIVNLFTISIFLLTGCSTKQQTSLDIEPAGLVNPLMGTDSEFRLSTGNTYPAIALPWGMNFWTPHTRGMNNG